jgi:hypothetical protein
LRQVRPLHCPEEVRDNRVSVTGAVDNDRQEEVLLLGHVEGSLDREFPLAPKIAFEPLLRMLGDYWNEQSAVADLAPDPLIPYIPASQLSLIEPDLYAGGAQSVANPLRSPLIL